MKQFVFRKVTQTKQEKEFAQFWQIFKLMTNNEEIK